MILAGAGVGGGSLVYANTLYEPLDAFYRDPSWAHITDWKSELAPYYDQAKRMLGVVDNPRPHPHRRGDGAGRRSRWASATPSTPRRSASSSAAARHRRRERPRPLLRWGRPRPQPVHGLRRVHDRVPAQRQEHPGQELPPPRRAGRRRRAPPHHGHPRASPRRRRLRGRHPVDQGQAVATQRHQDLHRRAGRLLGGRPRHPEAAAQAQGRGRPAPRLRPARAASRAPTPSRSSARSRPTSPSTTARASRSPPRFHPDADTHVEPVRYGKGSNFMALLQTVLADEIEGQSALEVVAQGAVDPAPQRARPLRHEALVGAHRHRAGHADPRQLDHHGRGQDPVRLADVEHAGPRRAQPDLHPGRLRRRTPDGHAHRRHPGRQRRRAVQPAADRPLHRRLHHRRLARDRGRRRLPAHVRPRGAARRRRIGRSRPTSASTRR